MELYQQKNLLSPTAWIAVFKSTLKVVKNFMYGTLFSFENFCGLKKNLHFQTINFSYVFFITLYSYSLICNFIRLTLGTFISRNSEVCLVRRYFLHIIL